MDVAGLKDEVDSGVLTLREPISRARGPTRRPCPPRHPPRRWPLVLLASLAACTKPEPPPPPPEPAAATSIPSPIPAAPTNVAPDASSPLDLLPLRKGTTWIYRGTVDYVVDGGFGRRTVTWKSEVLETFERGPLFAALVLGHPSDLPFTDGTGPRKRWILGRWKGRFHFEASSDSAPLSRLAEQSTRRRLFERASFFATLPLERGSTGIGPDGEPSGWEVERDAPAGPRIEGAPATGQAYRLGRRTLSDHTFLTLVEGVGITRFEYGHHGTLSDVELDLVEYRPGPRGAHQGGR